MGTAVVVEHAPPTRAQSSSPVTPSGIEDAAKGCAVHSPGTVAFVAHCAAESRVPSSDSRAAAAAAAPTLPMLGPTEPHPDALC